MPKMMIQHRVADFATWKPHFDAHRTSREAAGITNDKVYQGQDDPNDVVVIADVADIDAVKAWAGGPDLHAAMEKAGVTGKPTVLFG